MGHKYHVRAITTQIGSDYRKKWEFCVGSIADIESIVSRCGDSGLSPTETVWRKVYPGYYSADHHNGFNTAFYVTRIY